MASLPSASPAAASSAASAGEPARAKPANMVAESNVNLLRKTMAMPVPLKLRDPPRGVHPQGQVAKFLDPLATMGMGMFSPRLSGV
jgi:hypothetical protein